MQAKQRRTIGAAAIVTAFIYAGCNAILDNSEGQVVAEGGTAGKPAEANAGRGGQGTSNASGRNGNGGNGGGSHAGSTNTNTNTGIGGSSTGSGTALGAAAGNSSFVGQSGAATAGSGNTAGVGSAGRPAAAGGARPGGASGTAGRSAATGGIRTVGGASSSLGGGSGTGTTSACKSTKCGEGCTDNDPMNCGACGHRCSTAQASNPLVCTDGVCTPNCKSGFVSCNAPMAQDDGCECPGTACCGSECQKQHDSNGLSQHYYSCSPGIDSTSAMDACTQYITGLTGGNTYACGRIAGGCVVQQPVKGSCNPECYGWCYLDNVSGAELQIGAVWTTDGYNRLREKYGTWK